MKKPQLSKNQSRTLLIVVVIFAAFFVIDPFQLFVPSGHLRPRVAEETALAYGEFIAEASEPARRAMIEWTAANRIVMINERGGIAEEPAFLAEVLPALASEGGLDAVGLYFLLAEDQVEIDRLMESAIFDETLANGLLFNRNVIWGFQEYRDILEAAWEINRIGSGSLRVLGLNVRQDFSQIVAREDIEDVEKVRTIMNNGIPDRVMADTLTAWLDENPDLSVLVYATREQGFPDVDLPLYTEQMDQIGFPGEVQFARMLHNAGFTGIFTITYHSPWPSNQTRNQNDYPATGSVDAGLDLWERNLAEGSAEAPPYPIAFPVAGPFADTVMLRSLFNYGFPEEGEGVLTFSSLYDGYIVLKRIPDLTVTTSIPGFITADNIASAVANFPGPSPEGATVEDFQSFIDTYLESLTTVLEELR